MVVLVSASLGKIFIFLFILENLIFKIFPRNRGLNINKIDVVIPILFRLKQLEKFDPTD